MLALLLLLPLPLAHEHGGQHSDDHGDGDDEHGDRLGDAQLRVHVHQAVVAQHRRLGARQVVVVVQEEALHAAQLPEDALQVAVAVPRVALQEDVCAVCVDVEEGLEVDGGQPVAGQVEEGHAGERLVDARVRLVDAVGGQVKHLQRAQHGEDAAAQHCQPVAVQVELPQRAHGREGPHLQQLDRDHFLYRALASISTQFRLFTLNLLYTLYNI